MENDPEMLSPPLSLPAPYLPDGPVQDRALVKKGVEKAFRDHFPFSFEHRVILPNGVNRIVLGSGKVICDQENKPIKMIGTAQDITERRKTQEALEASQDTLQRIFNGSLDMVVAVNSGGKIIEFNNAAEK